MKPMKLLFLLCLPSLLFFACGENNEQSDKTALPKTLETFADSLVRLNQFSPASIDAGADYFQRLVPADSALADSAAVLFLRLVKTIVDTTNERLFQDTTDYFDLVYNQNPAVPAEQKAFQQKLARHHLQLQADGEGGVYVASDYQWIKNLLLPKTSASVDAYLNLLAKEEKDPTLLDAGLAVEATELADRLIASEELLRKQLPKTFAEDVARKNRFYTGTLLFGSDNSPALEYTEIKLTEEYQSGYDYLLKKYPASAAAGLIGEWQQIVAAKDSRKLQEWRNRYSPYYD